MRLAATPLRLVGASTLAATVALPAAAETIRFATFNASLNRSVEGGLIGDLSTPDDAQARAIAEIIQRTDPDVLLINEFDFDAGGIAAGLFQDNYLSVPQDNTGTGAAAPIAFDHVYVVPSNTGVPSGLDFDNDGSIGGPGDAFGFGFFPGQFASVVYSKYEIDEANVRSFQEFLWADMPGALLPPDPLDADGDGDTANWFTPEELAAFRLSSKNHVDVPILIDGEVVHLLASHPTPPVFDGPEDLNGRRNADEIRFWRDYINGAGYITDDAGGAGGLAPGSFFVIGGDQNADPFDGDSIPGAPQQLLDDPMVNTSLTPSSPGGVEQAALQGGANAGQTGNPAFDTADFGDQPPFGPGNLRVDYLLPSANLRLEGAGVFWPEESDPLFPLVGNSDHRLVSIDIEVGAAPIPVPASLLLLATGLAGLALTRRRG